MSTRTVRLALSAILLVAVTGNAFAQRRSTGGSGSSGRSAPSAGRSSSSGGSRRSGSGSGSSTRSRDSGRSSSSGSSSSHPSTSSSGSSGSSSSADASHASGGSSQTSRPKAGKIAAVKARAREVQARTRSSGGVIYGGGVYVGSCWNCGYWGWYGPRWGWYDDGGWWYPARHPSYGDEGVETESEDAGLGVGYMPYPYAESDGTGETFMRSRTHERRGYMALSGSYFGDQNSATRAGGATLEGAYRLLHLDAAYQQYFEPVQGGYDRLHTARASLGVQAPLGKRASLIAGVGARGVFLDNGADAWGPEGTLGLQLFPFRPIGLNVTGRLAGMTWTGTDHFAMTEVTSTGSIFIGRMELQAGWHYMKMEGTPSFAGPIAGVRLWF